jgi:hypothetical protein
MVKSSFLCGCCGVGWRELKVYILTRFTLYLSLERADLSLQLRVCDHTFMHSGGVHSSRCVHLKVDERLS